MDKAYGKAVELLAEPSVDTFRIFRLLENPQTFPEIHQQNSTKNSTGFPLTKNQHSSMLNSLFHRKRVCLLTPTILGTCDIF